jgi:predicted metalloprotease with PDZ domain
MRLFHRAALWLCFLWLSSAIFGQAGRSVNTPEISFTVSMPQPHTHLFEVEMRLRPDSKAATTDVALPVWTPGSYLVREYARHVQDFAAKDGAGRALAWSKTNKNTWRVERDGAAEIVVKYRVYAKEMSVRTNELNDRQAFFTPAALLMHPPGQLNAPATVKVNPYNAWRVATGLPPVTGQPNTFRAENFDVLYDSPFQLGELQEIKFEARGVPHRIVIEGTGNYQENRLREDTAKIVEAAAQMMGGLPYRDYTFLLRLRPAGGGGLEHLNSCALIARREIFNNAGDYTDFLTLVAHEFFHAWNVKRIRPDALGPFDYSNENYTKLLWVAEGLTSYYEALLLQRAGLMSERKFFDYMSNVIRNVQNKPGRRQQSLEDASFDAWIKYYRQDENSPNTQISYYDKGALVGMLLDLEIRRRSDAQKSLDDVMRHLYREFAQKNRNYTPADMQRICETMAGGSLEEFFRRFTRGRDELDYNAGLNAFGLRLQTEAPNSADKAYLGAELAAENGKLIMRRVFADSPAYEQGLNAGDEIIALDGWRVTLEQLNRRLAEKRPGQVIALTVFRAEELRVFNIKLGARVEPEFRIIAVANPTPAQQNLYQSWLGKPLSE